jgi:DNA-binding MarR family transcriptional regulator
MESDQKAELVREFCQATFELRYKLRKMFVVKMKEAGLSFSFEVLEIIKFLHQHISINQQELSDMLFKDKSSITYIIDNMVKAGLVERKEDGHDRRNKLIILTPKGYQLRDQIAEMANSSYLALATEVSDVQVKAGIEMLAKMNSSLADNLTNA